MNTNFRPYAPDQLLFLPPDLRDWLSPNDLVYFIHDVVRELDLSAIYGAYSAQKGGQPPYHPAMMVALLVYAYCVGMTSSRKIEQATYHSVAFRVLTADQHPDHDTISAFRKQHLKSLAGLFIEVLRLCQKAGLVKLGHVALDGTKMRANASKHKAMSYGRMEKTEAELEAEVRALLAEAETVDAREDALYGKGKRGDELPEELRRRETRLAKIREAKRALEEEAKAKAQGAMPEYEEKKKAWEGRNGRGQEPKPPSEKPDPKAQRNFTDPDSRIMIEGATKAFAQAYNCQAAVDGEAQVIVASAVTQQTNDKQQLVPMVEEIKANTGGEKPAAMSADSGYFSEKNVTHLEEEGIDGYVATGRQKHGEKTPQVCEADISPAANAKERMSQKLRTYKGRATYSQRKQIVEPVFGQIKEARGFRRFSFRGFANVACEWDFVCLTHNLLKLFRSGWRPATS